MAAGIGSRYGDSKQVDPIGPGGETIMDYSLYDARRSGFQKVVFVIRPDLEEKFQKTIAPRLAGHFEIAFVHQTLDLFTDGFQAPPNRIKPWGTAHALLTVQEKIHGPFAIINADDYYGHRSFELMAKHLGSSKDSAMLGYRLKNTLSPHGSVSRGICTSNDKMELQSVVEHVGVEKRNESIVSVVDSKTTVLRGDELVSMNFWGFHPSIFSHVHRGFKHFLQTHGHEPKAEFLLPTVVDELIRSKRNRVKILPTDDRWFGLTYREDKANAFNEIRKLVDQGIYPKNLWAG